MRTQTWSSYSSYFSLPLQLETKASFVWIPTRPGSRCRERIRCETQIMTIIKITHSTRGFGANIQFLSKFLLFTHLPNHLHTSAYYPPTYPSTPYLFSTDQFPTHSSTIHLPTHLPIHLPTHLPIIHPPILPATFLPICLLHYTSIHPHTHKSTQCSSQFIHPFIYLPIH